MQNCVSRTYYSDLAVIKVLSHLFAGIISLVNISKMTFPSCGTELIEIKLLGLPTLILIKGQYDGNSTLYLCIKFEE